MKTFKFIFTVLANIYVGSQLMLAIYHSDYWRDDTHRSIFAFILALATLRWIIDGIAELQAEQEEKRKNEQLAKRRRFDR